MRIYRVTYTTDLYRNGELADSDGNTVSVAATTMAQAMEMTRVYAGEQLHGFEEYDDPECDPDEGGHRVLFQYRDFEVTECQLIAESEIG